MERVRREGGWKRGEVKIASMVTTESGLFQYCHFVWGKADNAQSVVRVSMYADGPV